MKKLKCYEQRERNTNFCFAIYGNWSVFNFNVVYINFNELNIFYSTRKEKMTLTIIWTSKKKFIENKITIGTLTVWLQKFKRGGGERWLDVVSVFSKKEKS